MQPSAEDQVRFLTNIQRLLSEGLFTASYKYALLLALADLAVECGDDSGAVLQLNTRQIAGKFIRLYWRHVVPYIPKAAEAGVILQQNTDRQAAIVRLIADARMRSSGSFTALQRDTAAWSTLITGVANVVRAMPLWKLQRVGNSVLDFLYDQTGAGSSINLRPGVAFCLRKFHPLITEMVRSVWVQFVRKLNSPALGATADLEEFLFGSNRADLSPIRPLLQDLHEDRCFYCESKLVTGADVDHFIPWSHYPVDLGHNFVLAHATCNSAKGAMLAAAEHAKRWFERNQSHGGVIGDTCDTLGFPHDLNASIQVARWSYEQADANKALVWVRAKTFVTFSGPQMEPQ